MNEAFPKPEEYSENFINNLKTGGFNKYRPTTEYDLQKEADSAGVGLGIPTRMGQPFAQPKLFTDIQAAYQYVLSSSLPHRLDVDSLRELRKEYLTSHRNPEDKQLALNAIDYLLEVISTS
jgi:hypothetical protein